MRCNWSVLVGLFVILFFLFSLWRHQKSRSVTLPVTLLPKLLQRPTWRVRFSACIPYFLWISLGFLAVALSNPESVTRTFLGSSEKEPLPHQGIALYYVLDESGSMQEKVGNSPKIDIAKKAIEENLKERRDDLIGLITFARVARVVCPLTLDHAVINARLMEVQPMSQESTNGTAIGYAIFKTVTIFVATNFFAEQQKAQNEPVFAMKSKAIVVITDGLQSPHPEDKMNPFRYIPISEAVRYARQNGVTVYFIGIDSIFNRPEFAQDVSDIKNAVESTGGAIYITGQELGLEDVLAKINALEKSTYAPEIQKKQYETEPLFAFFVSCALFFLGLAMISETLICRYRP